MPRPKLGQQVLIADKGRVEVDGNGLGVVTHGAISRLLFLAAAVASSCAQHSFQASELGIRTPKSSHPESRGFVGNLRTETVEGQFDGGHDAVFAY